MAKTLLMKLAGTVDNDKLPYLGEIRISIKPASSEGYTPTATTQLISIYSSEDIPMRLIGDGHFTDSTLAQNLGKTYTKPAAEHDVYISDGTSTLIILNKYAITTFWIQGGGTGTGNHHFHWHMNAEDLMYMTHLGTLNAHDIDLHGDISVLSTMPALQTVRWVPSPANYKNVTGNLSSVSGLTRLNSLNLFNCRGVTGDISSLAGLTNLTTAELSHCENLAGTTSSIASLHPNNGGKLATLTVNYTKVTGTWPPSA